MSTVVKDLGAVSAYAYAVEKGYTGTEAEFAELMADYAEVGQRAEGAANSASESKTAAKTAATTATTKASEAATSAQTATTKAGEATTAAGTATTAKNDAVAAKTAAETAQGKAEDAQEAAESVAESIPSDYSQLSEDVSDLKEGLSDKADKTELSKLTDGYYSPSASLYVQGGLNADGTINGTKYYASTPEFLVFDYPVVVKLVDDTNYVISTILMQKPDGTLGQITNQLANGLCIDANSGFKIQIFKNGTYDNANLEEFSKQIVLETKNAYLTKVNNTNERLLQKNGYQLLDMYFRRGSVTNGSYLGYVFYRVSTPYIVDITRTITIQVKTGFRIGVLTYDADGTYLADSGWVTSRTVEAGSHIRIQIARVVEDKSEYADVWEFYSALSLQTELRDYIDNVSGATGSALNNPMFGCGRAKLNAHMGYHVNYPENSTKAYTEAGKLGYWGIEADVNKTSDGHYVMMHDTTVDRTTDGTGKISEMTLAQIRELHLIGDETLTVPTFEEYLSICKHYGCVPMIELKSTIPNTEAEYNTIIGIVEDFGFNENSVVFSGSKWALANFRKATDKYIYASIYQAGGSYSWDTEFNMNKAYKNTMMSWDIGLGLTAERVKQAHASGIPICAFITDTVASTESAFGVGADCCTTNVILPTD